MDSSATINQAVQHARQGNLAEAEALLRSVAETDATNWAAHLNLGVVLQMQERHADALPALQRAAELRPAELGIRHALAISLMRLNRYAEAIEVCRAALAIVPDHAEMHGLLAEALLATGDFKHGWAEYEWRWKCQSFPEPRVNFRQPPWRGAGESLKEKTILLRHEQGFGDLIQFVRYAPLLYERGANVIVQTPPGLAELVRHMPGVSDVVLVGQALPAFDLHIPILSLPLAFNTTLKTVPAEVPYLAPPAKAVDVWKTRMEWLESNLHVGIAWSARVDTPLGHRKSISPGALARLALGDDAAGAKLKFYSLQLQGRASAPPDFPLPLVDLTSRLSDFTDTAALIANLDLVICVDTAVAHLAGAMGKPVWLLLPFSADFRWMTDRSDSPWYPSMRLFRQPAPGDWDSTIVQAASQLRERVTSGNLR